MIYDREKQITVNTKPEINAIGRYFENRLRPAAGHDTATSPISIGRDEFDNTTYTSNLHEEVIMEGNHPSMLAVSAEGKELVSQNPGLLGRIAAGDFETEFIGEGDEGRVYKITFETIEGERSYALKYTFPISDEGELGASPVYTPGVDQMRALQYAQREDPVPGMTYAVPIVATLDMTLAPYMDDSMDAYLMGRIDMLSAQAQEQLQSVAGKRTLGDLTSPFLKAFHGSVGRTLTRLDRWYAQGNDIPFVSERLSFDNNSKSPLLVHVPALYELHEEYQADPTLIDGSEQERLDAAAAKCLIANEILVGQ